MYLLSAAILVFVAARLLWVRDVPGPDEHLPRRRLAVLAWLERAGWLLLLWGALLMSPVADHLPLELWSWLHGSAVPGSYYRVSWADTSQTVEIALMLVIVALVLRRDARR